MTPPLRNLALCLGLLCSTTALADARIEARRHFQRGMAMINGGEFDRGVEELKEAYAIKPHPNVLYNIARAYLDAGRVGEAQEYFRRYLSFNPPDSEQVRATLARLDEATARREQEVAVATAKPRSLEMPPPPTTTSGGAAVDAESVKKLNALMARLETAVAKAEQLATRPDPEVADPLPAPLISAGTSAEEEAADAVPYEETVVTASRRAQTTLEAPNASTIITGEEIRLSGATTLVEVLRRVPGADVMGLGVGSANVSLRGFNQRLSNKVLVLLDGRTEYQDFLGLTVWSAIPVGLEEIERIEVIRGPGSALYGANAMLGVINIITRAPGTGPVGQFSITGGMGDSAFASFVHSASSGGFRYRASAAFSQADKWSRDFDDSRPDIASRVEESDLALRSARGNLTTHYAFNREVSVSAAAGVNRLFTEIYPLGLLRNFYFDGLSAYAKSDLAAGPVHLKFFWNHLTTTAGPQYSALGEGRLDSTPVSNVFNGEALWQHSFELGGRHELNLGVEGRFKRVSWSFIEGLREELHLAAFAQDDWKIVEPFRIVASYRLDRHPLLDNGRPGLAHSPRVSAVWVAAPGHALRGSFATAFREPTFLESYTSVRIPVPGVPGASALTEGSTTLRPEQMVAFEVGYRGELPEIGLEWDLTGYQNVVRDLINLSAVERVRPEDSFDPVTNTYLLGRSSFRNEAGAFTARGVELGAKFSPVDGLSLTGSGAFQTIGASEVPEDYVCAPCTQAPAFKAFLGANYRTQVGFDFSVEGAYSSRTTWIEREPSAADPTQIQFVPNALGEHFVVNARIGYRLMNDKVTVALVGQNLGPRHQQHPFGNFVDRRFFGTLTVTP